MNRHRDPLPPGYLYNGYQYVDFSGEKRNFHPSILFMVNIVCYGSIALQQQLPELEFSRDHESLMLYCIQSVLSEVGVWLCFSSQFFQRVD